MNIVLVSYKGAKQLFNADNLLMAWTRPDGVTQLDCVHGDITLIDESPEELYALLQPSRQHFTGPR